MHLDLPFEGGSKIVETFYTEVIIFYAAVVEIRLDVLDLEAAQGFQWPLANNYLPTYCYTSTSKVRKHACFE